MERVINNIKTKKFTMVFIKKENKMDREYTFGKMEIIIKVIGFKEKNKGMASYVLIVVMNILVNGVIIKQ